MKRALVQLTVALCLIGASGSVCAFSVVRQKQTRVAGSGSSNARNGEGHPVNRIDRGSPGVWTAPPGHTMKEIETIESDCFGEVNKERRTRGLRALEFDSDLLEVARAYSLRMAEDRFFSHKDPDGNMVTQRVARAGIRWHMLAENLAYERGYLSPTAITMSGWMDSPGHRKNILDPQFEYAAIGVWISSDETVYFTEIFLKN